MLKVESSPFKLAAHLQTESGQPDELNYNVKKYTLSGLASLDKSIFDIYLHFFITPFDKHTYICAREPNCKSSMTISHFFKTYLEIVVLNCLIGGATKKRHVLWQIMSQKNRDQALYEKIDFIVANCFDNYSFLRVKNNPTYIQVKQIRQTIKIVIEHFVQSNEEMEKAMKDQKYPDFIRSKRDLQFYLKSTFHKIENLLIFQRKTKRQCLSLFYQQYCSSYVLKIPELTNDTNLGPQNSIYMMRPTKDPVSVFTLLSDYLTITNLKDVNNENVWIERLINDIVGAARRFHTTTGQFYPALSLQNMLFNQKSLSPCFSQSHLILESMGLHKNINNIEIAISLSTPVIPQFHECHLQFENETRWQLQKKYYYPAQYKRDKYNLINKINTKVKEEVSILKLEEKIHVWRLILIIYYVIHRKSLIREAYRQTYSTIFNTQHPPIYMELMKKLIKELYAKINNDASYLKQLLSVPHQPLLRDRNAKHESFDFSLSQLEKIVNSDFSSGDNSQQILNFQKIKQQIQFRNDLTFKIASYITDQQSNDFLRNWLNAAKYVMLLAVTSINYFYYSSILIKSQKQCGGSRRKLICFLNLENESMSYLQEKAHKKIILVSEKLQSYMTRKQNDIQLKYLVSLPKLVEYIDEVKKISEKISQCQSQLHLIEMSNYDLKRERVEEQTRYKKIIEETLQSSKQGLAISYKALRSIYQSAHQKSNRSIFQQNVENKNKNRRKELTNEIFLQRLNLCLEMLMKLQKKEALDISNLIIPLLNTTYQQIEVNSGTTLTSLIGQLQQEKKRLILVQQMLNSLIL